MNAPLINLYRQAEDYFFSGANTIQGLPYVK
jgi:hypothetical protein